MPDWTDHLPEDVERPIVVEVRYPKQFRAGKKGPQLAAQLGKDLEALNDDDDYRQSAEEVVERYGADGLTVLALPFNREDEWTPAEGKRGGEEARDVAVTVHFPSGGTVNTPEESAAATSEFMDWFYSSKIGEVYLRAGEAADMGSVRGVGRGYGRVKDLAHLRRGEDVGVNVEVRKTGKKGSGPAAV